MGSPNGIWKSTGSDYTTAEKLAEVEREIIQRKKKSPEAVAKGRGNAVALARQLDILRAIARDYRTKIRD